jgi:GNAT superfamily N-acetyltransferase
MEAATSSRSADVRRADVADFAAVAQVIVDAYVADGILTPGDDYAQVLANSAGRAANAELWVATISGAIVGSITFCPPGSSYRELARDGQGEFRMLGVAPAARGRGVAKALVAHCFDRCVDLDLNEIVICSMEVMTSAHALYDSFGFVRDESLDWRPIPDVLLLGFRAAV